MTDLIHPKHELTLSVVNWGMGMEKMRRRRLLQAVMFSGVLAASAVAVVSPASAGGPWHPVECTDNSGPNGVPDGTIDSFDTGPQGGACTNQGPSGSTYREYYESCDTKKVKAEDHEGILWQRGDANSYQCVHVGH